MNSELRKLLQGILVVIGIVSFFWLFITIVAVYFMGEALNDVPKDDLYKQYKKNVAYLANDVIKEYVEICNGEYNLIFKNYYPNDYTSNNVKNWKKMTDYLHNKFHGFKFLEFNDSIIHIERGNQFRYKFKYKIFNDSLKNNETLFSIHFIDGSYDK